MELEVLFEEGSIRLIREVPGPRLERSGKLLFARPRVAARNRPKLDMAKLVEEERNRRPR